MPSEPSKINSELSSQDRQDIDSICDEFELACKSGASPELDHYVKRLREPYIEQGLLELVVLDAFYNQTAACDPDHETTLQSNTGKPGIPAPQSNSCTSWNDYVKRFPSLAKIAPPKEFVVPKGIRESIGSRFKNVKEFAAGGLGKVSSAEDLQFNRTVAVKEIHQRWAGNEEYRQRFLREAEITGQLEHPGIVPVYVQGNHPNGEPYYVMRLIQGQSLHKAIGACADNYENGISIERRQLLNRFVDVCHTMEYAHSREVIHRDIKPENIMLGDYGETLLVDWGLAKRTGEELPATTEPETHIATPDSNDSSQTNLGTVMGTPAYMSPEQAAGKSTSVNKSSDIYSLGATLFHILTGKAPRFSQPHTGSPKHELRADFKNSQVPQAFQAICRHAMQDDPDLRYPNAAALAADVELVLADQPVSVYPDPIATRARRWIQNHLVLTAASLVAIGLAFVGAIIVSWISSKFANELMTKNKQLDAQVVLETQLRQKAQQSEQRTTDAMNYLVSAMRSPDPNRDGREIKVVDILEQAIEQLETDFSDDRLLKAQMLTAFGRTYLGLGKFAEAKQHVQNARDIYLAELGDQDRLTLQAGGLLARIYYMLNDPVAEELITSVVESSRLQFGDTDPDTLNFRFTAAEQMRISGKVKQAVSEFASLLPEYQTAFGPDDESTLNLMNNLAVAYKAAGRAAEAVQMSKLVYEKWLERSGPDSAQTISSGSNYAVHLGDTTDRMQAGPLHEQFLKAAREKWGNEHHRTLVYINRLGTDLISQNKLDRAIPLLRELFETSRSVYGAEHTVTQNAANSLAIAYLNAGEYENAATRFKELYESSVRINGPNHKRTLTYVNNLGAAYRNTRNYDGSIELLKSALEAQQESLGPEHPDSLRTMLNLAGTLQLAGRFESSIPVCREAHRLATDQYSADHGHAQTAQSLEAMAHLKLGDFESAKTVLQAGHESRIRTIPDHWLRYNTMSLLGEAHLGLGELEQAEPLLLESYQEILAQQDKIPARAQNRIDQARERIVRLYEAKKMPDEADKYRKVD